MKNKETETYEQWAQGLCEEAVTSLYPHIGLYINPKDTELMAGVRIKRAIIAELIGYLEEADKPFASIEEGTD